MKAHLVARYSPRRNEAGCLSCEQQIDAMRQWCAQRGVTVVGTYSDEAVSGGSDRPYGSIGELLSDRPQLAQALATAKRGETILVHKWDRLSRQIDHICLIDHELSRRGIHLLSATESGDWQNAGMSKMLRTILVAIAEYERAMIRARTAAAMQHHQRSGRLVSARAPYGYVESAPKELADGRTVRTLEADPAEQEVISDIVRMKTSGMTLRGICRNLESSGRTCRGGPWHHQTLRSILRREAQRV